MLMDDLRGRLANRVQLTTDGHKAYLSAVEEAFGADIDYGMLVKLYGAGPARPRCRCAAVQPRRVRRHSQRDDHGQARPEAHQHELHRAGEPDHADEHAAVYPADQRFLEEAAKTTSTWLRYIRIWYNFVRIHKTLRTSPAMAAGIEKPALGDGGRRCADRCPSSEDHGTYADRLIAKKLKGANPFWV